LPEVVDAVADMAGLRMVGRFDPIYCRPVSVADGVLCLG
jgi:hypothetical protein